MAIWECGQCSTRYAPGLLRCPHCQTISKEYDMPKTIVTGPHGASTSTVADKAVEGPYAAATTVVQEPVKVPATRKPGRPKKV